MNETDKQKQQEILSSLERNFTGMEVVFDRQLSRRLSSYYIRPDLQTQWIIKVTDDCIMENPLASILQTILTEGSRIMMTNPNEEIVLYQDLTFRLGNAE